MRRLGLNPDRGAPVPVLGPEQLEARRRGSGLAAVLPALRGGLISLVEQAAHIMAVVDADGRVLWRDGSTAVRRRADDLGFVEGVDWHENSAGTNAIGTALVTRHPVQVYSAEHYVRNQHDWTCAAAPPHDTAGSRRRPVSSRSAGSPCRTTRPRAGTGCPPTGTACWSRCGNA